MQSTQTRETVILGDSINDETQTVVSSAAQEPALLIKASDKFAPVVIRLLADLQMSHGDTDPADIMDLHRLSEEMEIWRQNHPIECAP